MRFPKVQSTFGVTPYNPERDTDEKRRAIYEHYESQMGAQPLPPETLPWNKPFPPGVEAQQAFDRMLQERVVDPLARAGYEGLGAGLAAIPSAAHEMIVPQTEFDIAGTIIPLSGVAKAIKADKRAFPEITKAMRAEKKAKDVREYSRAIKALRGNNANLGEMDDVDLGAIKISPDIKVTPGMAQKNFDASRNEAIDQEKFKMGTRPLSENPRSTEVTGIDGGVFAYLNDDSEFDRLLTLNKDLPGLEKLIKERAVLLRGNGGRTPSYYRETPGLRKIESEIAKILKENQNDLELPEYLWPRGKQVTPKDILLDKIMERDQINWSSDLQNRIDAGKIKNRQYRDQIESERLQEEYRKDKWSKKTAEIMQKKQSTKTENPFRRVTENLDESKLSPVQKFWNKIDDPEGTLKKTYDELAKTAASPYVGDNIANPVFQIDRKGLPTAQMPVEHFSPKNNHVGIGVELGRPDPFAWMDVKLGVSKNWLEKSKGKPRLIETMSDLIAHDDYMDHLNRGDRVVFHIYSTNPRVNRVIVPGAPNVKRIIDAAKKLQGKGVDAQIVVNKIPEMNKLNVKGMTLPEMRETGVRFEERNLGLDEEQLDRLRKVFGDF